MSDGDNATPGLPSAGPSHARGDNQWLTRSPQPSPGAAPWERSGNSDSGEIEKAGQTGNHTDGVTVADLIAKLHGVASVPEELRRTRPEPEPEPESQAPPTEVIAAVYVDSDEPDTEVIPVVADYDSEVPDLAARPATTVLMRRPLRGSGWPVLRPVPTRDGCTRSRRRSAARSGTSESYSATTGMTSVSGSS